MTASAQTFTQRVQQKNKAGEGTVTITQDKAIDDLVNGPATQLPEKNADETATQKAEQQKARELTLKRRESYRDTTNVDPSSIDTRKKVLH